MTHWIYEQMVFPFRGQIYHTGIRMSCDEKKTWIVAGTVLLEPNDSIAMEIREVELGEHVRRCGDWPRQLIVEVPSKIISGS